MNPIDRAAILAFHQHRIEEYGAGSAEALGWKNADSQRLRFDVLAKIGDLNDCTVLDVGCGHGGLRAHLGKLYPRLIYSGIDQMESFLQVAAERYRDAPDTKFYLGDFSTAVLPVVDYVLACGALGYRSSNPDFVLHTITRLYASCRRGLGFNLLHGDLPAEGILAAQDCATVTAHCRRLTAHTVLEQGYFENDMTIFMYRDDESRANMRDA